MNEPIDLTLNINIDEKSAIQGSKNLVSEIDSITSKVKPIKVVDVADMMKAERATRKYLDVFDAMKLSLSDVEKRLAVIREARTKVFGEISDLTPKPITLKKAEDSGLWSQGQENEFQSLLNARQKLASEAKRQALIEEEAQRTRQEALQESQQKEAEQDNISAEHHAKQMQRLAEENEAYRQVHAERAKILSTVPKAEDILPTGTWKVELYDVEKRVDGLKQSLNDIIQGTEGSESSKIISFRNQVIQLSRALEEQQAKVQSLRGDIENVQVTPAWLSASKEYKDTYAQLVTTYEDSVKFLTENANMLDTLTTRIDIMREKLLSLPSLESAQANAEKLTGEKDFAAGMIDRQIEEQIQAKQKALQDIQEQSKNVDPSMQAEYDFMAKNLAADYDNVIAKLQSAKVASNERYDTEIQKLKDIIALHQQYQADLAALPSAQGAAMQSQEDVKSSAEAIRNFMSGVEQSQIRELEPKLNSEATKLEDIANKANLAAVKYREMGEAAQEGTGKASEGTQRAASAANSLQSSLQSGLVNSLKQSMSLSSNLFTRLFKGFNKLRRQSSRSLKTIIKAIIGVRGLYMLIRKIKTMISTGFGDLMKIKDADFTKQINGLDAVREGFEKVKNAAGQIKYSLASAFMPIVEIAIPYIQQLLGWVDSLLNTLGQFMAGVTGHSAYTKAIKKTGDAIDKAGKAAGGANKQLSKFDELTNVTSSSGGGGGSDTGSAKDWTIEEIPISDSVKEFVEKFKSGTKQDWFDIGRGLADRIQNFLEDIDWDKIQQDARDFATRLAGFINGFFKPEMFFEVGKTVAEGLNTGLEFIFTLGDELEFEDIGATLREGVKGFLETFNWGLLADTIDTWVQGLADLIKGFVSDPQFWKDIKNAIVEFFSHLDIETVGILVGAFLLTKGIGFGISMTRVLTEALKTELAKFLARKILSKIPIAGIGLTTGGSAAGSVASGAGAAATSGGVTASMSSGLVYALGAALGAVIGKDVIAPLIYGEEFTWGEYVDAISHSGTALKHELSSGVTAVFTSIDDMQDAKKKWDAVITGYFENDPFGTWAKQFEKRGWDLNNSLHRELMVMQNSIAEFEDEMGTIPTLTMVIDTWIGQGESVSGMIEKLQLLGYSADDIKEAFSGASLEMANGAKVANTELFAAFEEAGIATDKLNVSTDDANRKLSQLTGSMAGMPESARQGFEAAGGHFSNFKNTVTDSMDESEQALDEFGDAVDEFEGSVDSLEDLGDEFSSFGDVFSQTGEEFSAQFGDDWHAMWDNVRQDWENGKIMFNDITKILTTWETTNSQTLTKFGETVGQIFETKMTLSSTTAKNQLTSVKDFIQTTFGTTVPDIFKNATNSVIGFINTMIASLESALNSVADTINNLQWKIPDVVPDIGGQQVAFSMNRVSLSRIPALASGTVIPPSMGRFIAQLGDNNRETEVVSPLSTIEEAVANVLDRVGSFGGGDIHIHVDLDGREVAKSVVRQNDIYRKSKGRSMFA